MKTNRRSGQGTLEFALMLPIFMFILLGIYDFSRAYHIWSNLNLQCVQAARVATQRVYPMIARNVYGVNTHTSLATVTAVFWQCKSPFMIGSALANGNYSNINFGGVGVATNTVTISAQYSMDLITPGAAAILGRSTRAGTITVNGYAQEQKE
jgi:Flp pilus assembly protein TadG